MSARLLIVVAVIGAHILGLWALQSGLLRRVVETIVPVQVLADFVQLPQPQVEPAPPPPAARPEPPRPRPATPRAPAPAPAPEPLPVAEAAPTAALEVAAPDKLEPAPTAATATAPNSNGVPGAAPAAPAPVVLPSSSAAYLNNPPPAYPPLSRRLGEQGRVVVRAYIDVDGTATRAEIRSSSGYDRLDQAALQTVLRWRYVPGKRGGVPEAMWFNIPISFVLE
ncbi:MAG TPA: energy transducer TonB [Hydrogenophaga sp.]|uniref:energy transducer TonB n=1 Tax=Hydrogenophaga sp. TaxID=1904254 RepID=UPI002B94F9D6|nr:energy transducer TonB [Hydrogenophaga sp.]HMN91642.1 energy transducer TonB [Hydrogenophaga sp.]HMP09986.1 energy transducer TonB [Hydrogenophaga sp.]